MPRRMILWLALSAWVVVFLGSFGFYALDVEVFQTLPSNINRLLTFVALQLCSAVLALICLGLRYHETDVRLKRIAAIPSASVAVLTLAIGIMVLLQRG